MEKVLFLLTFIFCATTIVAQDLPPNIVGVRAGINMSSILTNKKEPHFNASSRKSFNFGISYQRQIVSLKPFYLETGLYLSDKGFKEDIHFKFRQDYPPFDTLEIHDNYMTKLLYIQVPLVFNYRFTLNNNVSMEPFFGFYLSYGIGGKTLMFDNSDMIGGMHTEVVKSFGKDGVNDFDFGLKVGTGVIFYNIYVGLAYEFSTLKIGGNYYRENIIRNGNLSIHLGYNIPLYSKQQLKDSFNRIYPLIE